MAPDQVGRGQVVVTGDRVQRPTEPRRHVLHETRLAAAGRPLDQHRQAIAPGVLEQGDLVALRAIERQVQVDGSGFFTGHIHQLSLDNSI